MQHFEARLFFAYLLLTIIIELPVLFLVIRKLFKIKASEVSGKTLLLCGFLCSFATYPYVWYVFPALITDELQALIIAETVVILIESVMMMGILKISCSRAFITSLLCNLVTIVLGTLMNSLIIEYRLFLF